MEVSGQVDTRSGPVRECFAEVIRGQAATGAAFAAFCDGRLVADLWGGWADQVLAGVPRPGDGQAHPVAPGRGGGAGRARAWLPASSITSLRTVSYRDHHAA